MKQLAAIVVVALGCGLPSTTAQAAPLRPAQAEETSSAVVQVHFRPRHHCHWRFGHRRCHSDDGPGMFLKFGRDRDHGRHHRHHDRHDDRGDRHDGDRKGKH